MGALVVDRTARTIAGMAVPYGPVGHAARNRWQFDPGCLVPFAVMWLLIDHDQGQRRGRVIEVEETAQGLWAKALVRRGPVGDQALALVEDGVLRGMSVGIDNQRTVRVAGITVVRKAQLREVSLTARPAFEQEEGNG